MGIYLGIWTDRKENEAVKLLTNSGFDYSEAQVIAKACRTSVDYGRYVGALVGGSIGGATFNPATIILATITSAGGGILSSLSSSDCEKIRYAAKKI